MGCFGKGPFIWLSVWASNENRSEEASKLKWHIKVWLGRENSQVKDNWNFHFESWLSKSKTWNWLL